MRAYGAENTPHWPDVSHCTNTVIIAYKLNHSHNGAGSEPLSCGKWLSISTAERIHRTGAEQIYRDATHSSRVQISVCKNVCEKQQFVIFCGPGCCLLVVSVSDT